MKEKALSMLTDVWGLILQSGPKVIGIIIITMLVSKFGKMIIESIIRKAIKGEPDLDPAAEIKRENTLIIILVGTFKIVLWVSVILVALSEFGVNIGPLIAGAGVVGIAVGFGGQYLIKDIITGIFILLENQYRIEDVVEISGIAGKIEDISLRKTTLRDINGTMHHIPHGEVTTVSNMSKGFSSINVLVGIGYDNNIKEAADIINKIGEDMFNDPDWALELKEAPHFVRVDDLGDHAVILKIVGNTHPGKQWSVAGEVRQRVLEEFQKAGIDIPYPQVVVHNKD